MNDFRSNPPSNSDEVYVFGHIFRTGFNQIYANSSPAAADPARKPRSKENSVLQFISQILTEEEGDDEDETTTRPFWLPSPSPEEDYDDGSCAKRKSRCSRGGGGKKREIVKEVVDLRSLLLQSAQAAANFDNRAMADLLVLIRKHSSPQGDSMERAAHCFANALEARMDGTGPSVYAKLDSRKIPNVEMLKAYRVYIKACPFRTMSNVFASTVIGKIIANANGNGNAPRSLHVIDFGIRRGYQWPCLIQALSEMPGGPPKLRITGIDFPQMGFRSAEMVVETGCRLAKFCDRMGVPFVYNAIAQNWGSIRVEDLRIQRDEILVVNSMYRLHHLPDESDADNSPRDAVLRLIRRIDPDVFVHGVINAAYTTPFFATRFKEAFYHFSSMFDMLGSTAPDEDDRRLLLEEQMFEKEAVNAIACEGVERIERPETYKNWQLRSKRGGFRQVAPEPEAVRRVSKARVGYHKDFSVDEDGKWVLLGWKGRIIYAISCWQSDERVAK